MPPKPSLTAASLQALGAARLAELLLELAAKDAVIKRRLCMEVTAATSPRELAREIQKRLATIARARSFVDWQGIRAVANDLEMQRQAIVTQVAATDPAAALDLLWQFMGLAASVFERCDDSNGTLGGVFRLACRNIGDVAGAAAVDPVALADRVYAALIANDYGQYDSLIGIVAPALGASGLAHLKQRMIALSAQPVPRPADKERVTIGWSPRGPLYADEIEAQSRQRTVTEALKEIADAEGDVDAFIAQYDDTARRVPRIAAEIAQRLLAAGRAGEALAILEAAAPQTTAIGQWPHFAWTDARIDALEALGRTDAAQEARWDCFARTLSAGHLRAYLKKLPDFEDVEAEIRALTHAEQFPQRLEALWFLVSWPALDRAARLVTGHAGELDGNHYDILAPAAEALAAKQPLAATLVLRAMIDFALAHSRTSRYRHAANHLHECARLARHIPDFGAFEPHDTYLARLRQGHGRKQSFWNLMA
jgi:hypothetical protein